MPDTPQIFAARRKNFTLLTFWAGGYQRFVDAVPASLPNLFQRKHNFLPTAEFCRTLEQFLGLPVQWMDVIHQDCRDARALVKGLFLPKPGRANTPELTAVRHRNLVFLVGSAAGSKAAFCRAVNWHQAEWSMMFTRTLGPKRAESLELKLGLPVGWLDLLHDVNQPMPIAFNDRLLVCQRRHASEMAPTDGLDASIRSPLAQALVRKIIAADAAGTFPEQVARNLLNTLDRLNTLELPA